MVVVLRSKLSGYYFKDFGVWTASLAKARPFSSEWVARSFVECEHLTDVQIVESEAPILELDFA